MEVPGLQLMQSLASWRLVEQAVQVAQLWRCTTRELWRCEAASPGARTAEVDRLWDVCTARAASHLQTGSWQVGCSIQQTCFRDYKQAQTSAVPPCATLSLKDRMAVLRRKLAVLWRCMCMAPFRFTVHTCVQAAIGITCVHHECGGVAQ